MSTGLATTLNVLTETANEAAVRVLTVALDATDRAVRDGAIKAILLRRGTGGGQEILRRLDRLDMHEKAIVRRYHGRLGRILRDALVGPDADLCRTACFAAVEFHEYDLIPTLLTVLEDRTVSHSDLAAQTLVRLVERLNETFSGPHDPADRRDPELIRGRLLTAIEDSVKRFAQHRRSEPIEALLMLAGPQDPVLMQVLGDPHHAAFRVVADLFSQSTRDSVIRLLLDLLDDPRAPTAALTLAANRTDTAFVARFLHRVGRNPTAAARQNLKRIRSIPWLRDGWITLDQVDEGAQHGAVRLVMAAGIPRVLAFSTVRHLLLHGKPAGRREAALALADFNGADANALALAALDDRDPQVQANIVSHIRSRGSPGVLQRLVDLVDSPHVAVRRAARRNLAEFTFPRYAAAFDALDEEVRITTGALVRKIDPETLPLLREEMRSKLRARRLRAIQIARALGVVEPLEDVLVELLVDEDHLVRAEAASLLAAGTTLSSRTALDRAVADRSQTVRDAAKRSLKQRDEFDRWREELVDPRD